jgi:hypothetical protein
MRTLTNGLTRMTTVCLAVAALGGCGGDGGGDEETYVRTYESACKSIIDAPQRAGQEAQDIDPSQGQAAAIEEYKQVLTGVFEDMRQAFDQLIEAEAPDKWADFQSSVRESGDAARQAFDEADQRLEQVETPADLERIGDAFETVELDTDDLPADLAEAAPSCKKLEES